MKGSPTSIAEYFDHSKEYLYSFADKDFRLVKANSLFLKKFQLHSEDYVGKPFQDVIQQIESKKIVQAGKFCLEEPGTTVKIEVEITAASGEENWFQWEISSLHCNNDEESGVQIIGIDITEKKRSERQLLYQAVLLDNISDAVISTDKWFRLKSLNKAAEKIFHVKASDAAGVPLTEFFDNEAPSSFNNIISTLQKIGYWNGELKLKKSADQKESYQSFSITSVKDNQDVIIGYLAINRGYYRNPANKKMSVSPININNFEEHFTTSIEEFIENKLKVSEKNLRHVLSSISEGFFMLDKTCHIIVANKSAKKMIERVSGRLLEEGHSAFDYLPDEKQKTLQAYVDKTFRNIRSEYESFYSLGEGNFWLNLSYSPVKDDNKQIIGACIIARDITEQKNAEKELDKSQHLFKSFMANTPAMGWVIDEENKFRYLNKAYKTNFRLDDSAIGKSIYTVFPKSICDAFIENNRRVWKTGGVIETIEEGISPEGKKQVYQIYKFPLGVENGKKLLGGVALDITEQEMLQQKLATEEKKKKKEIIQAIIDAQEKERRELAYELHDNVNQILSSSKLMLDVVADSYQTNTEMVSKSSEYLSDAIKELRRISHNLSPGILKDISLEAAILDVVEQINSTGKIHIVYRKRNYVKDKSKADSDVQLTVLRIAQEQLNNIIKHAGATEVLVQLYITKSRIILSIKDNGKGFNIQDTKRGLGLHNIFNRTEYYQGVVELKSETGKGCLLKIEIPYTQSAIPQDDPSL